jgi:2-phosphoglycerate kinase
MENKRNWTVLFVGGASGTGKSILAKQIGKFYGTKVLEVDDIGQALRALTSKEILPALHFFSTGINWKDIGVEGNVNWLISVGKEIIPALKRIADRHIAENIPIVIEGDFINPEFTVSFRQEEIKSVFLLEPNKKQLLQNFLKRDSGELQNYMADICIEYEKWLKNECIKMGIKYFESRPWKTQLERVIEILE